ncbi:Protein NRT1/ PTR family 5.2 [Vitis vinifera]|uniref:Protein NRT1/ PTR family 5.2 n=1 Tax=Vitis vinifera TaxID=29760 RepID=A0A438KDQ6_VITVI|nr:Protein NRT1/ PTR family 5.2 [Vitis vinifera]
MLMEVAEERGGADGREEYTKDGTVDLKGRPILRSKTGRWRACSFIVGYEMCERMSYYGIASNLVLYLTRELHEGTVKSANNVTNWAGFVWMAPILGAYIADAHLGRYRTFVIASGIYLLVVLNSLIKLLWRLNHEVGALRNEPLDLSSFSASTQAPSCGHGVKDEDCEKHASTFQVGIFYFALYIIAIGTGGTKPNISTMGADQFDDFDPKERTQKLSFFNFWMLGIVFGTLFSYTFLVYIQDNVGWSLGYGLPTLGLALSILVFLVAAVRKWKVPVPKDPKELHELSLRDYSNLGNFRIDRTPTLRVLDKAAVKSGPTSPWMLCPVSQVEETKQMIKMIPVLIATLIPSTITAQVGTLFIKQGTTLNRSLGPHFDIPPACLTSFVVIFMFISLVIYERHFVPAIRKYTGDPRGISLLQRLGIGLVLHIIIMVTACFAERTRLSVARENGILGKNQTVPLTIFILLPQFALMGYR